MDGIRIERSVEVAGQPLPLDGWYDPAFGEVADAFVENFISDEEYGSAVSVVVDGSPVVDLWGGWTDADRRTPWAPDTIVCMMSVAKGIAGLAFAHLVDRGLVELDEPVATYWPEFAQNGKERLPVRYLLDHRAGLPVLHPEHLRPGAMFDRAAMVDTLAAQAPLWEPGTVAAYHVHTQGYLLGEVMRRTTGRLMGEYLRDEITGPLDADYWMGVPPEVLPRIATLVPHPDLRLMRSAGSAAAEDSLRALAFLQNPDGSWADMLNSTAFRTMEMPSASGHGNARAVARIYGAVVDGSGRVLSPEALERMSTMQHDQIELLQERHYRQGLGVLLNSPGAVYMGPHDGAFGHHGIGGSIGFADPTEHLGFAYSVNRMHAVGTNGPRAERLIDAVFRCL